MTLRDIDAHCEKDEARMDGAHAKMEKFTDEGTKDSPKMNSSPKTGAPWNRIAVVAVVAIVAVSIAVLYLQRTASNRESDPVIVDAVFVNGSNGLRFWINASDSKDEISTVTIAVYNDSIPLGSPVLKRTYWVNQTVANVTGVLTLFDLPSGNYFVAAYATDMLGNDSTLSELKRVTLPI